MWIKICNFAICWLVWKNWSTKILAYNPVLVRLRSQIKKRKIKVLHKVGSLRSWNYNTAVKDYVDIVCGKTVRSANLKVRFVEKMWKWVPVATISRILLLSLFSFIKTYNPIEFLSGSVCWIIFTKTIHQIGIFTFFSFYVNSKLSSRRRSCSVTLTLMASYLVKCLSTSFRKQFNII